MSELTDKLKRMLSQAQGFGTDAPIEALSRLRLVEKEAEAALPGVEGGERSEVESLLSAARSRRAAYEARLSAWQADVAARSSLYTSHEQARIGQPIPPKV